MPHHCQLNHRVSHFEVVEDGVKITSMPVSKQLEARRGVHVEFDRERGIFTGIPDDWIKSGLIPPNMVGEPLLFRK